MQISDNLAFSCTEDVLLVSINIHRHNWSESYLQEALLPTRKQIIACLPYRMNLMAMSPNLMFINDVTVMSVLNFLQNVYFGFVIFGKLME